MESRWELTSSWRYENAERDVDESIFWFPFELAFHLFCAVVHLETESCWESTSSSKKTEGDLGSK